MVDLSQVQKAYQGMLREASQQFEQQVNLATQAMQKMIAEAQAQMQKQDSPEPEPEAKAMDGGLWLNAAAVEMVLAALEKIALVVEEMQGQIKQ